MIARAMSSKSVGAESAAESASPPSAKHFMLRTAAAKLNEAFRRRDWLNDDMDTHAHEVQSIFESPPMFANPTAGDAPKKDKKKEKKRKGRISMCMRLMNMRE